MSVYGIKNIVYASKLYDSLLYIIIYPILYIRHLCYIGLVFLELIVSSFADDNALGAQKTRALLGR